MNEEFRKIAGEINGIECFLITPAANAPTWTKDNLWDRSRVVGLDGTVLSQSFGKFFNYGEQPELYSDPEDYSDWLIEQKLDGSTCIVDLINDEISIRTRGSLNVEDMENKDDFYLLTEQHPGLEDMLRAHPDFTFLFEITTPNNQIVINYDKVEFTLIGAVDKRNLRYATPLDLVLFACEGGLQRPKVYHFSELATLVAEVKDWSNNEGVVITYNRGQDRVKIKSDDYCFKHRVVAGLTSTRNLVDIFEKIGAPSQDEFEDYFLLNFDFEVAESVKEMISEIIETYADVLATVEKVSKFVKSCPSDFTRKEYAGEFSLRYKSWHKGLAFLILDKRDVPVFKFLRQELSI